MSKLPLLLLSLLLGTGAMPIQAFEEGAILAKQHLIENPNASWNLDVKLNHPDGRYRIGEQLRLSVTAPRKCYMHIISINPEGELNVLWPLTDQSSNLVEVNQEVVLPTRRANRPCPFKQQLPLEKN